MSNERPSDVPSSVISWAVGFELSLGGLALLLGWLYDVPVAETLTWRGLTPLGRDLLWGLLGVLPLWIGLLLIRRSRLEVWRDLGELLRTHLGAYFSGASRLELACVALAAGIGEELLFRGFLLEVLARHLDPAAWGGWQPLPLLISSLVFGVVHYVSGTYLVLASVVGGYLGLLMITSGSLWVPLITHTVYDFVALCYLQHDWRQAEKKQAA